MLYLATAIPFLMWFRRAYENLAAFGATRDYSPGWAVGAFFVPVLHLVRPYHIAEENWDVSHIAATRRVPSAVPVSAWWFLFWGMNILSMSKGTLMREATTIPSIQAAAGVAIFEHAATSLCAAFAVVFIWRVQWTQRAAIAGVKQEALAF